MPSSPQRHRGHEARQYHSRRAAKNAEGTERVTTPEPQRHGDLREDVRRGFTGFTRMGLCHCGRTRGNPFLSFPRKRASIKPRITGHKPSLRFPESEICRCDPRLSLHFFSHAEQRCHKPLKTKSLQAIPITTTARAQADLSIE